GRALPSRRARPRRPECPQHPVRRRRQGLADRLRSRSHAHPRNRVARAQPGAPPALAAQAARRAQRGRSARGFRAPARRLRQAVGTGHLTMAWTLRFQGVGNASAVALGSPMATIERDGAPWLVIDCGGEGLTAYLAHYGAPPPAMFVTHVHLDHVAGFERLFVANYFDLARRGRMPLYVPVDVLPLLHRRVADYPNALAEGGANFWDAFRVVPVGDAFWHDGVRLEVFE